MIATFTHPFCTKSITGVAYHLNLDIWLWCFQFFTRYHWKRWVFLRFAANQNEDPPGPSGFQDKKDGTTQYRFPLRPNREIFVFMQSIQGEKKIPTC